MAYWIITIIGYLFTVILAVGSLFGLVVSGTLESQTQVRQSFWAAFVIAVLAMLMATLTHLLSQAVS